MAKSGEQDDRYAELGVDAGKAGVRAVFHDGIDNDFPGAWVNIVAHPFDPDLVMTQHMDGDGSKSIQRLLAYAETGDPAVFAGMVDDAVSMNSGDMAAAGFVGAQYWTDVLNVNSRNAPKEVLLRQIKRRFVELRGIYREHGFQVLWLGGETADLPQQVQTLAFDVAMLGMARRRDVIKGDIRPGDRIWGFASDGQAAWENEPNSGIMSNGLTLARTCLMDVGYNETYPQLMVPGSRYEGRFTVCGQTDMLGGMTVGDAIISPTRQWAILIKILIGKLVAADALHLLHGISMNTGGGASKIANLGNGGILFSKEMPIPPPIFQLIQQESEEYWRNMFRTFNCGVGLDVVGDSELRPFLKETEAEARVRLFELGVCASLGDSSRNVVQLSTPYGILNPYIVEK